MTETISAEEFNAMQATQNPRKYRNEPTMVDGIRFDSKAEARRFQELKLRERAGEIRELALQPKFDLKVNAIHIATYRADFEYLDVNRGAIVVEDVKGVKTPAYRLKKKLMFAIHGIDIQEIPA